MYRRQFMQSLALGAAALGSGLPITWASPARAQRRPINLQITNRTIEVNGRSASVFGLVGPDGKPGLTLEAESPFDVSLANNSTEATLVHWHGLTPPWEMDGVPDNPAPMIEPGQERRYTFPLAAGGTHWMHAHTLQEQNLLAAPLIVLSQEDRKADVQDVVVLLHDFSFRSPEELLVDLKAGVGHGGMMGGHAMMMQGQNMSGIPGMAMPGMQMDLNDIDYDAYLANDRTLDDPEVFAVDKGGLVRLRIINGATATNFTIDTGILPGRLAAVDGQPVEPVSGMRFGISMGQRLDIMLDVPAEGGAFPVLALREGARERTGIVLATRGAAVTRVPGLGAEDGPVLDFSLESRLRSPFPVETGPESRAYDLVLSGSMSGYDWRIGGADRMRARRGDRIRLSMTNMSMMGHPMHLHGHHFRVVGINGRVLEGAVRDTVYVPPMATVDIAFTADNSGRWPFHCHHLYHMASGMMAYLDYDGSI
ncbi:multicopper oxidase family protein [Martelella lutilitoris]|uniref:Multicopper oxidase family protein n=1 Tax=Martelella lutilitoris TaxID=2583532 RepID=A0A7T7KJS3_9HYPH|nr:multicopper oxidase family protein [Martelella lutilitoris]QQM28985.1 multicopper oxidase family protein [Martelella lutilitoris]